MAGGQEGEGDGDGKQSLNDRGLKVQPRRQCQPCVREESGVCCGQRVEPSGGTDHVGLDYLRRKI